MHVCVCVFVQIFSHRDDCRKLYCKIYFGESNQTAKKDIHSILLSVVAMRKSHNGGKRQLSVAANPQWKLHIETIDKAERHDYEEK